VIIKRKLKKWWWTIPPISAKRTIIAHLNWTHWIQTRPRHSLFIDISKCPFSLSCEPRGMEQTHNIVQISNQYNTMGEDCL